MPYVDNSYKLAGGGILSTVGDLLKFGNYLLNSYQKDSSSNYLTQSTMKNYVWSKQSVPVTIRKNKIDKTPIILPLEKTYYGLGWQLVYDTSDSLKLVYHTGGAVGASSCLLIIPKLKENSLHENGIVVAVLCNSDTSAGIVNFTREIANIFID